MNGNLVTVKGMFQIGPEGVPYAPVKSRYKGVKIVPKKHN